MFTVAADGPLAPPDLLGDLYRIDSLKDLPQDVLHIMVQYCKPFIHPSTTTFEFLPGFKRGRRLVHNNDFSDYSKRLAWVEFPTAPSSSEFMFMFSVCTMGDYVYLVGGSSTSPYCGGVLCRRYHPESDTWSDDMPSMHRNRGPQKALVVYKNRLYALGRLETEQTYYEFYDPDLNEWTLGQKESSSSVMLFGNHSSHVFDDKLVLEYNDYITRHQHYQSVRSVFTFLPNGHLRLLTHSKLERDIRNDQKSIVHGNQRLVIKHDTVDALLLLNLKTNSQILLPHLYKHVYHHFVVCACKVSNDEDQPFRVMCLFKHGDLYLIQFDPDSAAPNWTWTLLDPVHPIHHDVLDWV
jgi:hypothetical protein